MARPEAAAPSERVVVFVDYVDTQAAAHEQFHPIDRPFLDAPIDPVRLAHLVVSRRGRDGVLTGVRVYGGRPTHGANNRLGPKLNVIRPSLRQPNPWLQPASEKGVDVALAVDLVTLAVDREYDVGIVVSRDPVLVTSVEFVLRRQYARVEVATWNGCRPLRLPGTSCPPCHFLGEADYRDATP